MLASTRPAVSPFRPPLIRFLGTVVGIIGTVGTNDAVVSFGSRGRAAGPVTQTEVIVS